MATDNVSDNLQNSTPIQKEDSWEDLTEESKLCKILAEELELDTATNINEDQANTNKTQEIPNEDQELSLDLNLPADYDSNTSSKESEIELVEYFKNDLCTGDGIRFIPISNESLDTFMGRSLMQIPTNSSEDTIENNPIYMAEERRRMAAKRNRLRQAEKRKMESEGYLELGLLFVLAFCIGFSVGFFTQTSYSIVETFELNLDQMF